MQGLSIATAGKAAVSAGPAAGAALSGNAGAGDVAESSAGSAFGAILAGQIKGRVLTGKSGAEETLQDKTDADKGKVDGLTLDGSALGGASNDLLALVNAGVVVVQMIPLAQAGAAQGGSDRLASSAGVDAAARAGQWAGLVDGSAAGKVVDVGDVVGKVDAFAGVLADKTADGAAKVAPEGFAVPGNMLPTAGAVGAKGDAARAGDVLLGKAADGGKSPAENAPVGGKTLAVADPVVMKPAPDEFKAGKSASDGGKTESAAAGVNDLSALLAVPQTPVVSGGQPVAAHNPALEIAAPVGSPGWGNALADKVTWMSSQGNQVAELHLNPPHLGPLEVQLTISNDQASAVFVSHSPAVREAVEAAMPRLREMLADNGIMLGNTMVGAESFQQQQQEFAKNTGKGGGGGEARDESGGIGALGPVAGGTAARAGNGMVDTFV